MASLPIQRLAVEPIKETFLEYPVLGDQDVRAYASTGQHNWSEDIDFYLVGAGTHPDNGMPGVLSTARIFDAIVPDAAHFGKKPKDLAIV